MKQYEYKYDADGQPYLETELEGLELTRLPLLNKSTAFTPEERSEFGLWGLLPPHISNLDKQVERTYLNLSSFADPLNKHIYLRLLQDRNEVLFYATLEAHLEEIMPIIYTPTVAEAVRRFSQIYRFPRGLTVSTQNIQYIDQMLSSTPYPYVKLIVATDAEGILGIGDQGFGGMAICIGKLSLYTAAAGVDPALSLPIQLDVGTNSETLLNDPLYLGVKHERLVGDAYFDFMDTFVAALKRHHPNVLLQWEDFSRQKAFDVLERYADELPSFNDDIQGTGAVVLSGLLAAAKRNGRRLTDETFVVYGAGAGGVGVARQIQAGLVYEGLSEREAASRIYMMDPLGLVTSDRPGLESFKHSLAQDPAQLSNWQLGGDSPSLLDVIRNTNAMVLLGLSGQAEAFTSEIVQAVSRNTPSPVIFPLSNPTSHAEATPKQIFTWSEGRATVATGSPFEGVNFGGRRHPITQGNNAFIFPGFGLAVMLSGTRQVTPSMLTVAARALSDFVDPERLKQGAVFPEISRIRDASRTVAVAVLNEIREQHLGRNPIEGSSEDYIDQRMWRAFYRPIRKP